MRKIAQIFLRSFLFSVATLAPFRPKLWRYAIIGVCLLFLFSVYAKIRISNKANDTTIAVRPIHQSIAVLQTRITYPPTPTPTLTPTPTPTPVPLKTSKVNAAGSEWGKAEQIGEHTYTMKVSNDISIGSAMEIVEALNAYRQRHGKGILAWDSKLGEFAQKRAEEFTKLGNLDNHAGFQSFLDNTENFKAIGFMGLGENSSFGFKLSGVHLIEWVYAGDKPHDDNQLNPEWTHVGIGVSGVATDLVFGKDRI